MNANQVYAVLDKKIKTQGVSQEKVDKAVESYFERHPVERLKYNSTDRTVK